MGFFAGLSAESRIFPQICRRHLHYADFYPQAATAGGRRLDTIASMSWGRSRRRDNGVIGGEG